MRDRQRVEAICDSNWRSGGPSAITIRNKDWGEKVTLVLALLTKSVHVKLSNQCYPVCRTAQPCPPEQVSICAVHRAV